MTDRRLTVVLGAALAASLAFNLFFLGSYWSRRQGGAEGAAPERIRQAVAEELALDDGQLELFDGLAARVTASAEETRREVAALRRRFWQELGSPRPDRERLASLLEEISGASQRHHLRTLDAMSDLLEVLRPDQRQRFRRLLRSTDPLGLRLFGGRSPGPRERWGREGGEPTGAAR